MPRYLVGIDLGTTNSAVAYVDTASRAAGGPKLHTFNIPQVVAAGQVQVKPLRGGEQRNFPLNDMHALSGHLLQQENR